MKKIKARKLKLKIKRRLKRYILLIGILVILLYCGSYVNAGVNDSLLEKRRIDGVYAVAKIDGINRIFYLNMYEVNGRISYCIDLGIDITTSIYNSTNDFSISYLNDEQIEYIRSISYFGYGYEEHDDYKYYMAAQEIIWEYLSGFDVIWTSEMKVDGNRINIDSYKEEILNLRELYNRKLDISFNVGQDYMVGEEIELLDNNSAINDYEVVSSKYSNVLIQDNKLVIKIGNVIDKEEILLRRKGYYNYDSSLYYYDGSQKLISNGNYKGIEEIIEFDIKGVVLKGMVVDSSIGLNFPRGEATLEGAVYEVYDEFDNLIGAYQSNINGIFVVDNLPLGTYYIQQKEASFGYLVNNQKVKVLVDTNNLEVKLKQQVISNKFEIKKLYGRDNNYKAESGIMFDVYDYKNNHYMYLFTDGAGIVSFELPYGNYTVHQLTTTSGYSKVDDFFIEVKEHNTDVIYYNLFDDIIKAKIRVVSLNSITLEKLSLRDFLYKIKRKDDNTYLEFDGESVFATDNNGDLIIPISLEYGDYILEQVGVPEGVLLNDKFIEFSINDNSNLVLDNGNLVMTVNIYNELVRGKVNVGVFLEEFYKDVNDFGYNIIPRSGDVFTLIANEDVVINNKVVYFANQEVYSGITGEDGNLIIENLYLGNYCLIDEKTGEKKCFTLKSIDNRTKIVEEVVEFVDFLIKYNIIIQNKSSFGNYIGSSLFELIAEDGIVIYTGSTNDEGIIKIKDVLSGAYCIKQKSISLEYQINDEEVCFILNEDKNIEIINENKVTEIISVPDTLSKGNSLYEIVVILIFVGTGIIVYKKIFASKLYR